MPLEALRIQRVGADNRLCSVARKLAQARSDRSAQDREVLTVTYRAAVAKACRSDGLPSSFWTRRFVAIGKTTAAMLRDIAGCAATLSGSEAAQRDTRAALALLESLKDPRFFEVVLRYHPTITNDPDPTVFGVAGSRLLVHLL